MPKAISHTAFCRGARPKMPIFPRAEASHLAKEHANPPQTDRSPISHPSQSTKRPSGSEYLHQGSGATNSSAKRGAIGKTASTRAGTPAEPQTTISSEETTQKKAKEGRHLSARISAAGKDECGPAHSCLSETRSPCPSHSDQFQTQYRGPSSWS